MFYILYSLSDDNVIEYRDTWKLDKVHSWMPVSPYQVGRLCTPSFGGLLFVDHSWKPNQIKWINPGSMSNLVTPRQPYPVYSITHTNFEDKDFVIITHGNPYAPRGGIYAYNTKTNNLEWSVEGRLPGMNKVIKAQGLTTDDQGHLFVCDENNKCVQMFNVADGRYLGTVIKEGEQGLGQPCVITWCSRMSSLVVIHFEDGICVSLIQSMNLSSYYSTHDCSSFLQLR